MNRLFQLLCIFVLLLPAATAIEYSDCSNYPDADLILLLEESVRDVSYLDVPTGASLPDGWSLYRESYISDEDVIAGEEEKDYVSESNYNENNFDYRYAQLFTAADGSIVLVYIDYFKNENQPRYILEAYRKVISGARNVAEIRSTGTKYGDEGIICHVEDEYHLYFRGGSKFYMIYGNSSASIELAAKLYVSELKPILVTEKYHWMAKVCKTGTDRCTKYVYYGRDYESIDSLECKVTHGSDSTECPEDRIETTGSYIKVPFHSCSKDDILDLSYERTTTFPMAGEFWSEDFY
ncbi:MAG: hypothetical protein FJY77_02575, partial [Candidatus Altiarchaeales archaeon]|nr:hypothetical protein [Candidatus Altiarchaeales archaeon]